jgi:hypothetical protein
MFDNLFNLFSSILSSVLSMEVNMFCFGIAFVIGIFLLVRRLMRV